MIVLDMYCSSVLEFIKANGGRICLILGYIDYSYPGIIVVTYNILHTIPVYIRETNMKRAVGRWKLGVGPCNS